MRVKPLQKMYYNRREYAVGEEYEMDDREEAQVKLLVALGKLVIVPAPKQSSSYHTESMTVEPAASEPVKEEDSSLISESQISDPETGHRRRHYKRRDMRAEE